MQRSAQPPPRSSRQGILLALTISALLLTLIVLVGDSLTDGPRPFDLKSFFLPQELNVSAAVSLDSRTESFTDATIVISSPDSTSSSSSSSSTSEPVRSERKVEKVHVHLHTIGDSLTAGMFRNLLQSKTYRTMARFYPYAPYVASALAQSGKRYPQGPSQIVSYSSSVFAYPGARTEEVMSRFLAASDALVGTYISKSTETAPIAPEIWDVLLHRLPPRGNVSVLLGPLPTAAPPMRPRPPQVYTAARGVKKVIHFGPPPPPLQLLDHLVVVCMVLSGTNDALHAPDRFENITLPDDVAPEVALQSIHALHAACRNNVLNAVRMYERRRQEYLEAHHLATSGSLRGAAAAAVYRANTTWRDDVYMLRRGAEGTGDTTLVLPTLKVTILSVPITLPPMLIRNDSSIMQDLLLPRRHREDSNRLYGRLCLMWNHTAEAVLRSRDCINNQLRNFSSTAAYLTSTASVMKAEIPPYVTLRVASKPFQVDDVLLAEPPSEVKRLQGGYFCDCIHPSLAGYQVAEKSILRQLSRELRYFL